MARNTSIWIGLIYKLATQACNMERFQMLFSRAFDIGGLFLTLHDGSKLYFDNVADKVVAFWRNYFEDFSDDKDINTVTTDYKSFTSSEIRNSFRCP